MSEGDMTVGNYQLKNCVASGSTTQIWECSQTGSPMQLAMKLMLEDPRKISAEKNVLKHQYKVGNSLDHPSFLRFHEIEINRDHAFFVMDFFRSPSLKTHITSNLTAVQSCFPKLSEALATAYEYMHESGWLHRDIKPDNILVNKAGEARVIDFNLASRVKGSLGMMLAGKQTIQGTRTYIAPETILKKPATRQTDIYSLGVTFFEVLTGHPPFAGDTPNALLKKHLGEDVVAPSIYNPNVTKDLDKIIFRMLEKNPKKRFETMQEIASALRQVKCFEEDPVSKKERLLREEKERQAQSEDSRLDSRADADRTSRGIKAPVAPKKVVRRSIGLDREEAAQKAKDAKKQQQQGGAPQQHPGMMPGMPMPQQPMPPMGYPGMPMQPGMGYPGMPMPQQPMMPGQPMPYQQPPHGYQQPPHQQQPMPPQQPMPGQQPSAPQQPGPQNPPHSQQPPQQAQPQQPAPAAQPSPPQPAPPPAQQAPPQPAAPAQPAPAPQPPAEEPKEMTLEDMMDINIE